ncbi:MAG: hypothetical protein QOJ40_1524 [Verrucomicrobiota bacterium]
MSAAQPQVYQLEGLFREVKSFSVKWKKAAGADDQKQGISGAGRSILQVLEANGALTVPQIARLCSTSRQNIQVAMNRLNAKGYVELISNPAHKRSVLIRLTERGKIMGTSGIKTENELLNRVAAQISQTEVMPAIAVLRRVGQLLAADQRMPAEAPRGELRDGELRVERAAGPKLATEAAGEAPKKTQTIRRSPPRAKRRELKPTAAASRESPPAEEEFPLNLL